VLWSMLVGYWLGLLYLTTGNLAACVAFHSLSNWVTFHGLRADYRSRC
jgi:hypothetical protein